ncbi:hypothetical protein ACF06W_17900 [Streptomyces albus]|uniref:hypothetical protein n=1 Tax=Streptomyces albus TaxID=1888 RepID=UPI0036FC3815
MGARLPALERVLGLERVPGLEPVVVRVRLVGPGVRAGPPLKGSVRRRRSVSGWGSSPLPVPYWPTR